MALCEVAVFHRVRSTSTATLLEATASTIRLCERTSARSKSSSWHRNQLRVCSYEVQQDRAYHRHGENERDDSSGHALFPILSSLRVRSPTFLPGIVPRGLPGTYPRKSRTDSCDNRTKRTKKAKSLTKKPEKERTGVVRAFGVHLGCMAQSQYGLGTPTRRAGWHTPVLAKEV